MYPHPESGIYAGISIGSIPGDLKFYYDSFKKHVSSSFSASGNELLTDYQINPSQRILCRLRYMNTNNHLSDNTATNQRNILAELNYKINQYMKWKWRMDYSIYSEAGGINEKGYAIYQEVLYEMLNRKIELTGRITLFNTNSFNTRIYQYEKNLTGTFNMSPLFDEGTRWYLNVKINIGKALKLQCKYSETTKPEAKTLGSGNNEIIGNIDNQLSLQLDLKI